MICKHCDFQEAQENQDYCYDCTHCVACEKEIEATSEYMFCKDCLE